jgi:hypothetical protein
MVKTQKIVLLFVLAILFTLSIVGCGTAPVAIGDIPAYPGAQAMATGENEMADEVAKAIEESSGGEGVTTEVHLYSLPTGTAWSDIEAFYDDELAGTDWESEADLTQETEFFSTLGWSRGGGANEQALVIGYMADILGTGSFLIVGLFSE